MYIKKQLYIYLSIHGADATLIFFTIPQEWYIAFHFIDQSRFATNTIPINLIFIECLRRDEAFASND